MATRNIWNNGVIQTDMQGEHENCSPCYVILGMTSKSGCIYVILYDVMRSSLVIDGSYGEGGGQVLRTSFTLAALLRRPIRVENIRARRKNPGLQPQHLTAARAVAKICGGRLHGDNVGSTVIEFDPLNVEAGDYTFDVSEIKASAGSTSLILQTVLLPLAFAGKQSRVTIRGGTHVPWSPPANYIDDVYLPVLSRMDLLAMFRINKTGYYPVGGGEIQVDIRPTCGLGSINFTDRPEGTVTVYSAVSNLPESIAERQMTEAVANLQTLGINPVEVVDEYSSPGKGTVTFILYNGGDLKAGFTGLGERGKPAEKVAREAADEFSAWWKSGAALDKHLADQIILPMALADGESVFTTNEITQHLLTNIHTIQQFLPVKIALEGSLGSPGRITVIGAGM